MFTTCYLLEAFRSEGVGHVFLVPGGLIDPFLPALAGSDGITPVVAAHEAGAACMADGYARAGGRFGVCFAIGSPAITNMVTAVAAARTDFFPVFVVSGQVPTNWEGRGGFQDSSPAALNGVAVLQPITISIYGPRFVDRHGIDRLWCLLIPQDTAAAPVRVLILAGAGVEKSGATEELIAFSERFEIPVAATLRAKGAFPEDHRLSLGVFGYAGHRHAIETILSDEVEVLLVLGSGLSQRDTLFWDRKMLPSRALVQVDIDPQAIGRTWHVEVPVVGDCGLVLQIIMSYEYNSFRPCKPATPNAGPGWKKSRPVGRAIMTAKTPAARRCRCTRPG